MKREEEQQSWRHELKFVCTQPQLEIIKNRVRPLLAADPHTGPSGTYRIRSVYFDDVRDSCFYENEDGTDPREKFRIRIYNGSSERITLELKQKCRGLNRKLSCPLTDRQCRQMLGGGLQEAPEELAPLLRKWQLQHKNRLLRPKAIVEYERTPYIFRLGNVRVTLDQNITAGTQTERFLEGGFVRRPILPAGQHVLEVKYDAFLPDPVRQLLALETLQRTSFSKYYLCRKFNVM
ncbi:MAG: polyphosphate polymerase domain-containing protein [Eubacteriales bacterium]|nr:polyphosphate polymerase domain-containing protein [Eubacteriales bacterium]